MFFRGEAHAIDPEMWQSCMRGLMAKDFGMKLMTTYKHALTYSLDGAGEWASKLELEEWMGESEEIADTLIEW